MISLFQIMLAREFIIYFQEMSNKSNFFCQQNKFNNQLPPQNTAQRNKADFLLCFLQYKSNPLV